MTDQAARGQVQLAGGRTALALLRDVLAGAVNQFPDALRSAAFPADADVFRKTYPEALPRFEAARVASGAGGDIARHLALALRPFVRWQQAETDCALHEALQQTADAFPLESCQLPGQAGWRPSFVYRGERWDAERLTELGALLANRGIITAAASEALDWLSVHALNGGVLALPGRRIAMLGAGAEMAPTRHWLEAGADVLWLDTAPPPQDWLTSKELAGRLFWPGTGVDLLTQPREVLATLIAFADGTPLDVGLYAYAPGQARELRLTGVMNALVDALPADLLSSVTMLVSPTTPTAMSAADRAAMSARRSARPVWEAGADLTRLLGRGGGCAVDDEAAATRTVVSIQGGSYQAAQYLGKIATAQTWATHGQLGVDSPQRLRVSANTAAITRTRSLDHPVFAAAFGGAAAFGIETLVPRQSRCLNGLLALHDWLHPELPVPGAIRVHGGIHTLPYPLGSALRVAAAIGFARSPRLLRGLVRG